MSDVFDYYNGKKVVITGGTGSIGAEILGKIYGRAKSITVLSRTEDNQKKCLERYPAVSYIIGDVRDYSSVRYAIAGNEIVIHCAAMKHVDLCEKNPHEAVLTNIMGVQHVKRAAIEAGSVNRLVVLSTDKAADPHSVMGMTKYLQERTVFSPSLSKMGIGAVAIRPGNVLGSRGSVVEIFKRQKDEGKPITLTNPDMLRFVMTKDMVSSLILWAGAKTDSQDSVFFIRMPTVSVRTIAEAVVGEDYPFVIVGERSGEKLSESLYTDKEAKRIVIHDTPIGTIGEIKPEESMIISNRLQEFGLNDWQMSAAELRKML